MSLGVSLALAKRGLGPGSLADAFYTPYNHPFYAKYRYCELDENQQQIRLLQVKPRLTQPGRVRQATDLGGWKMLACKLLDAVPLSRCAGLYCALSYSAGNPNNTMPIMIDGFVFNAFAQLVHAIESALDYWEGLGKGPDHPLMLWVDQICINQSNPIERGKQVTMMRDIYSRGAETLVCLSTCKNTNGAAPVDGLKWLQSLRMSGSLCQDLWEASVDQLFINEWLESFEAFVQSPWWKRSWVYQEFVCSPKVQILYGNQSVAWELVSPHLATNVQDCCKEWSKRLKANAHQVLVHRNIGKAVSPQPGPFDFQEQTPSFGRLVAFLESTAPLMDQLQRAPYDRSITPGSLRKTIETTPVDSYASPAWNDAVSRNFHNIHLPTPYQDCVATLQHERHRIWLEIQVEQGRKATKSSEKLTMASAIEASLNTLIGALTSREIQESLQSIMAMVAGRSTYATGTCIDLRDVLRQARAFQASDKRDKVYAFLALADAKAHGFRPDYSSANTVLHVYSDTARRILERDGDLTYILQQATFGRALTGPGAYLPTWAPNWAHPEDRSVLIELMKIAQGKASGCRRAHPRFVGIDDFHASTKAISSLRFTNERGGGQLSLHLGGYRVARLSAWTEMKPRIRKFYVESRLCVYASSETFAGDEVWVLLGSKWPVVLRPDMDKYVVVSLALLCNVEETALSDIMFGNSGQVGVEDIAHEHICLI